MRDWGLGIRHGGVLATIRIPPVQSESPIPNPESPIPAPMHDTLLLFGATGDLAQRYLFPSLLHLLRDRLLPDTFRVVAVGRSEHDDAGFKQWLRGRLDDGDDRAAAVADARLARIQIGREACRARGGQDV